MMMQATFGEGEGEGGEGRGGGEGEFRLYMQATFGEGEGGGMIQQGNSTQDSTGNYASITTITLEGWGYQELVIKNRGGRACNSHRHL